MSALPKNIEDIHPSLWRATQLARAHGRTVDTGYAALSAELPGNGWPLGTLIELHVQQAGIGEVRLLGPALKSLSKRPVALIQPPQVPYAHGFAYIGVPENRLLLLRAKTSADALWSSEQILKAGTCGAVVLWQNHVRAESLRRLLLASQTSDTLFIVVRPLASVQDASPAALRLALRPAEDGISVDVVKRKGPARTDMFAVKVLPSPVLLSPYGRPQRKERPTVFIPASPAIPVA